MKGKYESIFCSICGWQKTKSEEILQKSKLDIMLARQFSKKAKNSSQPKIRDEISNSEGCYDLSLHEIERMQKIYNKNSKIIDSPSFEPTIWVIGKRSAVEPRVYRGTFHDRD